MEGNHIQAESARISKMEDMQTCMSIDLFLGTEGIVSDSLVGLSTE